MNSLQSSRRLNGLDTLRAAAIGLVFMYHYLVTVSHERTFGLGSAIGWVGVDLFFVLSGYLIGNQLFATMASGQKIALWRFYGRRFLRTLPNYTVVLALYFVFPLAMGGSPPPALWRFLTFTQNFGLPTGTAFSHAWSLCIEEQFYLVLPAITLLVGATRSVRLGWIILLAMMLAGVAARTALWLRHGADGEMYYRYIYYATWCRFDELLPGVALALLKNFHPLRWQRLTRHGNRTLLIGVCSTALTFTLFLHFHEASPDGYRFWMTALGYPMLAVSFAVLTLAALSPDSWLHRLRIPGASSLALWSYAIYLTHKPVLFMLKSPLARAGIDVKAPLGISVMCAASVLAGWLLFVCVETPGMRLRERWFGTPARGDRAVPAVPAPLCEASDTDSRPVQISEGIPTP